MAVACGALGFSVEARAEAPRGAARNNASEARRQRDLKAYEAFLARRFQESLDLTAALYADFPEPIYLRNLGRCHQLLGHPAAAIYYFREYLAKEKNLPPRQAAEVQGFIRQSQEASPERNGSQASVSNGAAPSARADSPPPPPPSPPPPPPPTTPLRGNTPSAPAAAGAPQAEPVTAPGARPPSAVAASSAPAEAKVDTASGLSRSSSLGLAVGLGTVGLAAVAVGSVFGLQAKERADQSNAECAGNVCSPRGKDLRDDALGRANVSTVAFVAGGVFLGAGLYFLLSAPPTERTTAMREPARGTRFAPQVSAHGALIFVRGTF